MADFLPTITIKAKDLATEITNFNVNKNNMLGQTVITTEHVKNNTEIRDTLIRRGIYPESLPAEEDIKKIEKKVNLSNKSLEKEKLNGDNV